MATPAPTSLPWRKSIFWDFTIRIKLVLAHRATLLFIYIPYRHWPRMTELSPNLPDFSEEIKAISCFSAVPTSMASKPLRKDKILNKILDKILNPWFTRSVGVTLEYCSDSRSGD